VRSYLNRPNSWRSGSISQEHELFFQSFLGAARFGFSLSRTLALLVARLSVASPNCGVITSTPCTNLSPTYECHGTMRLVMITLRMVEPLLDNVRGFRFEESSEGR
jgi:hypothetical protein